MNLRLTNQLKIIAVDAEGTLAVYGFQCANVTKLCSIIASIEKAKKPTKKNFRNCCVAALLDKLLIKPAIMSFGDPQLPVYNEDTEDEGTLYALDLRYQELAQ